MSQYLDESILDVSDVRRVRTVSIHGVSVPYRPTGFSTAVVNGQREVTEIFPTFITQLQNWVKYGTEWHRDKAMISLVKEFLLEIVRGSVFTEWCWEAPVAVSADVPTNHVYCDYTSGRIVLNEFQATNRYIDADGDRALLIFSMDRTKAVLVKYPLTSQPLILTVTTVKPKERFYDLTPAMARVVLENHPVKRLGVNEDEELLFMKKHTEVPVGLLTNTWNSNDLYESAGMSFSNKMGFIFNSHIDKVSGKTQRAIDIEDSGMKVVRKADKSFTKQHILEFGNKKALDHQFAFALTSCSSIGTMGKGKDKLKDIPQLRWITNLKSEDDVHSLLARINQLDVEFRDVKPSSTPDPVPAWVEDHLFSRLMKYRLLKWDEYPSRDPEMPPSILLTLTLSSGQAVALTDIKREGRSEGMTYGFMLPPVFDNRNIYTKEGTIAIPATHKWMHPADHLAKCMTTFDSRIRDEHGQVSGYYPKTYLDHCSKERKIKVSQLYKWLMEYCGKYGDPVPATWVNGALVPSPIAREIVTASAVIDYGMPMDEIEMYQVAKRANAKKKINIVGSKSTNREVRKYMLANKWGGPVLDNNGETSPYRGGANRSQLQRGLVIVKATVAFVDADTRNGIFITPSGIEKQLTSQAFLPKCFGSEEEYYDFLKLNGWEKEQCPASEITFRDWQSGTKIGWVVDARKSIKIGKLVDRYGNKFMPRAISQVQAIKSAGVELSEITNIDLVFPYYELVDKDCHHFFLSRASKRPMTLLIDGEPVEALVMECTFLRTGAASENIPPRFRMCSFKGIDSYPIWWQVKKIKPVADRLTKMPNVLALFRAFRELSNKFPERAPTNASYDDYENEY